MARSESGEKPGLLERALRQQRQLVKDGGLADTFYFRADEIDATDPEITEADIMAITREMNAEIERIEISGEVNVRAVQCKRDADPLLPLLI